MKGFFFAVCVLVILLATVIASSAIGTRRIDAYSAQLPSAELPLQEALPHLLSLQDAVLSDLFLLNHLFHHERIDELNNALARTKAAAQIGNDDEYAILRDELQSILDNLRRDLTPRLSDII